MGKETAAARGAPREGKPAGGRPGASSPRRTSSHHTPLADYFGIFVLAERRQRGWPQEYLAQLSLLSQGEISLLERQKFRARLETVERIAVAFGYSLSETMRRLEQMHAAAPDGPPPDQRRRVPRAAATRQKGRRR